MLTRIKWLRIYVAIDLCTNEVKNPIVTKCTPLCIDYNLYAHIIIN